VILVVWDGAVVVHPCRVNSRDRSRVYWQTNYQL